MKQQHEMKMVELMSTPQKREWREAQFNLMMAETRAKRAALDKVEEDTTVAEVAFPTDQGDAWSNNNIPIVCAWSDVKWKKPRAFMGAVVQVMIV